MKVSAGCEKRVTGGALSLLLERAEAAPKRYEGTRTPWLGCACRVLLC